ncbi:uncharacterized protein Z519_06130 [Cladophialophora bantiana CBS 173.52]|uniref:Uncharacterized protein n=1 Tax=Cladophialophora bantiana (strain ATCC 10958 / CBS 173.52 / CDC B-1940 / NIH 8579) TaxID=1442370 RepID=A0A0D2HRT9_CLAB1|nr:uncharacterized protein Z519_06130 [Cladophialophora bantiana CBS 173.52]KIW93525.1 hypothetical protein Z519_06130 [Cladophialophora bantiana CBS 173.52]
MTTADRGSELLGTALGAQHLCRFLKGDGRVDVGFLAHPSLVSEEEAEGINGPVLIAAAKDDFISRREQTFDREAAQGDVVPI